MADNSSVPPGKTTKFDWQTLILSAAFIAIVVLIFIVNAISGTKGVLNNLSDERVARGLITFLIAVATVAIAIILALSAVISDPAAVKDRFALGKEVLSILIGVLGTIVGFYFGSATTGQSAPQVVSAIATNEEPRKGDKTTIVGFITGGRVPYTYSITFDPNLISPIKDVPSPDGTIKQDIQIAADVQKDTPETFVIDVKDSDNKTVTYNKNGAKKITIKAPPPTKP